MVIFIVIYLTFLQHVRSEGEIYHCYRNLEQVRKFIIYKNSMKEIEVRRSKFVFNTSFFFIL